MAWKRQWDVTSIDHCASTIIFGPSAPWLARWVLPVGKVEVSTVGKNLLLPKCPVGAVICVEIHQPRTVGTYSACNVLQYLGTVVEDEVLCRSTVVQQG